MQPDVLLNNNVPYSSALPRGIGTPSTGFPDGGRLASIHPLRVSLPTATAPMRCDQREFFDMVRYQNDCRGGFRFDQHLHRRQHLLARKRIEAAGRLIENEQAGAGYHRAGDQRAHALAAAERGITVIHDRAKRPSSCSRLVGMGGSFRSRGFDRVRCCRNSPWSADLACRPAMNRHHRAPPPGRGEFACGARGDLLCRRSRRGPGIGPRWARDDSRRCARACFSRCRWGLELPRVYRTRLSSWTSRRIHRLHRA